MLMNRIIQCIVNTHLKGQYSYDPVKGTYTVPLS